jgi:hypothetical protein
MSRQGNSIKLFDMQKKAFVDAMLYDQISEKNIDDFENSWLPLFESSKGKLRKKGLFIEDANWDWNIQVATRESILAYQTFAIEANDMTQGMMIIESVQHTSQIEKLKPLIYIEYLATAPWNRKMVVENPRFRLTGSLLLAQAIGESLEKGFKGRIGLHSLPKAEAWYEYLGLTNFGIDTDKKLPYLELDKKTASHLLKKIHT